MSVRNLNVNSSVLNTSDGDAPVDSSVTNGWVQQDKNCILVDVPYDSTEFANVTNRVLVRFLAY
jgi:hypothetical protein